MGMSLGTGIVGTVFIGLAVYNFVFSHVVLGVLFAAVGAIGWALGFFSNRKIGKKKVAETEPHIQEQLDIAYNACEQAHALLV
jgi:drug/metabolite transporter (DMT)-like permease